MANTADQIKEALIGLGSILLRDAVTQAVDSTIAKTQRMAEESASRVRPAQAETRDPYAILRVQPSATLAEVKDVYRVLSRANHPDHAKTPAEKAQREKAQALLNWAYATIKAKKENKKGAPQ